MEPASKIFSIDARPCVVFFDTESIGANALMQLSFTLGRGNGNITEDKTRADILMVNPTHPDKFRDFLESRPCDQQPKTVLPYWINLCVLLNTMVLPGHPAWIYVSVPSEHMGTPRSSPSLIFYHAFLAGITFSTAEKAESPLQSLIYSSLARAIQDFACENHASVADEPSRATASMSTQENSHPAPPTPSANPQSRPPSAAILLTPASGVMPAPESLASRQNSLPTPPATGTSPLLHKSTKHGSGLRIMQLGPSASSLMPIRDRNAHVPATPRSTEPRIISKEPASGAEDGSSCQSTQESSVVPTTDLAQSPPPSGVQISASRITDVRDITPSPRLSSEAKGKGKGPADQQANNSTLQDSFWLTVRPGPSAIRCSGQTLIGEEQPVDNHTTGPETRHNSPLLPSIATLANSPSRASSTPSSPPSSPLPSLSSRSYVSLTPTPSLRVSNIPAIPRVTTGSQLRTGPEFPDLDSLSSSRANGGSESLTGASSSGLSNLSTPFAPNVSAPQSHRSSSSVTRVSAPYGVDVQLPNAPFDTNVASSSSALSIQSVPPQPADPPPLPPVAPAQPTKPKFTDEEDDFVMAYMNWRFKQDPEESTDDIMECIAQMIPWHTTSEWKKRYRNLEDTKYMFGVKELFRRYTARTSGPEASQPAPSISSKRPRATIDYNEQTDDEDSDCNSSDSYGGYHNDESSNGDNTGTEDGSDDSDSSGYTISAGNSEYRMRKKRRAIY